MLPSQQPAQLPELQATLPMQTPARQLSPAAVSQARQNSPRTPHWGVLVPAWQLPVLTSMQPAQGVQLPLTQVLPTVQLMQAAPPVPQR